MNISAAIQYGRATLSHGDSPEVDTTALLCHVLQCQSSFLHAWSDNALTAQQQQQFEKIIAQRLTGMPIAHIIGTRGFWSLDLKVTPATLIPRPDTELLVTLALEKIQPGMTMIDLGTGTGAVGLSLAIEQPEVSVYASDYSWDALQIAQHNAAINHVNNVQFIQTDWLQACQASVFDLVVSNPPYIVEGDPHLIEGDVQFEPISALTSGEDGLNDIRAIVAQAKKSLKVGGWLMIEHGYDQAESVRQLYRQHHFSNISSHKDYGNNDRVVIGQLAL
jgi:release factor glutamine methyltransferase